MEKVKHTPGPWETREVGPRLAAIKINGNRARCIKPSCGPAFAYLPEGSVDVQAANGRLIAACPKMYDFVLLMAKGGNKDAEEILRDLQA